MKKLTLTQGYEAIVDDDDFEEVTKYRWHVHIKRRHNTYARNSQIGHLHRHIMMLHGVDIDNKVVDHINGNGLDNRFENLRVVASRRENSRNRISRNSSKHSPYTGVTFRKHAKRWAAKLRVYDKSVFLGYFDTAEDAGMAYDRAVLFYFPDESTILNFPERVSEHDLSKPYERKIKRIKDGNTTGFRGVFPKKSGKFSSSTSYGGREDGVKIHLGTFDTKEEAAWVYDIANRILSTLGLREFPIELYNFPDTQPTYDEWRDIGRFLLSKSDERFSDLWTD